MWSQFTYEIQYIATYSWKLNAHQSAWGDIVALPSSKLTLTWPKPMVTAAAQVKPLITGYEMKSSRKPAETSGTDTQRRRASATAPGRFLSSAAAARLQGV